MTSSGRRTLVYLVRHGQTPLNESGVLRGLLGPPLNDAGRHQARRLGAVLGSRGLSAVVASPPLTARCSWRSTLTWEIPAHFRRRTGASIRWRGNAVGGIMGPHFAPAAEKIVGPDGVLWSAVAVSG